MRTASTQSKLYKVIAFSKTTLRCCLAVTSEWSAPMNINILTAMKRSVQQCLNRPRRYTLMSVDLNEPTWTWVMSLVTYIKISRDPKNGVWSFLVISDREEVSSVCFTVQCWEVSKSISNCSFALCRIIWSIQQKAYESCRPVLLSSTMSA